MIESSHQAAARSGALGAESTGDEALDALLNRIERDVAGLGRVDLAPLVRLDGPSAGLVAAGRRVERIRRRLQAFDTAYVSALEQGDEPVRNGCPSTAAFLRAQLRLSPGEAKARVVAARACAARTEFAAGLRPPERPALAAARAAGAVSAEHSTVILAALAQLPARTTPEDVAGAETCLVDQARAFDPGGVAVLGRQILSHIDPDGTLRDHEWKQRIRGASLARNHDGTGTLRARLTPEALEVWQTVLDPLAKPQPTDAGGPDRRSAEQRVHDAIHDAGIRLLDAGDLPASGGTPATVVIHLTQEQYAAHRGRAEGRAEGRAGAGDLDGPDRPPDGVAVRGAGGADRAGLARTEHGALLPVGPAFAMADQAVVCTLLTDGRGVPLRLARTSRIATSGQTIALAARDRGCTFPGCDRPAAWAQRHHVIPWHLGGTTDLDNLALVCGYHHRGFEALGWQCVMLDGLPHWIPPAWIDPARRPMRNTVHDDPRSRAGP